MASVETGPTPTGCTISSCCGELISYLVSCVSRSKVTGCSPYPNVANNDSYVYAKSSQIGELPLFFRVFLEWLIRGYRHLKKERALLLLVIVVPIQRTFDGSTAGGPW